MPEQIEQEFFNKNMVFLRRRLLKAQPRHPGSPFCKVVPVGEVYPSKSLRPRWLVNRSTSMVACATAVFLLRSLPKHAALGTRNFSETLRNKAQKQLFEAASENSSHSSQKKLSQLSEIPLTNTSHKYLSEIPLRNTSQKHLKEIPLTNTSQKYLSEIPLRNTSKKSAHTALAVKACLLGGNSYTKCSITFVNIAVAISALAGGGAKNGFAPRPDPKNGFAPRPEYGGVFGIFRGFLGV